MSSGINYIAKGGRNPWENLALAVVVKAIEDYRWGLKRYNARDKQVRQQARDLFHDAERFLLSDYCEALCGIKGEDLIYKLRVNKSWEYDSMNVGSLS